jgi:hypothetical protein
MKKSIMNLTQQLLDTELGQAALVSKLSGKPAHVFEDVFAWNGKVLDRATAVIALLKVYNQVPIGDSIKMNAYNRYHERFNSIKQSDFFVDVFFDETRDPATESRIWFNKICTTIRGDVKELPNETVKQILVTLHS